MRLFVGAAALALAVLSPTAVGNTWARPRPDSRHHNVLLITLDTTRADHLGCYGDSSAATPVLDALAGRGTLFEQAFSSCPQTLPAHATMMTGLEPPEHGVHVNGKNRLSATLPTLASHLSRHGYHTGAFVAAFVLDRRFGLASGFDVYDDDVSESELQEVAERLSVSRSGDRVVDSALEWLRKIVTDRSRRPFFCWVHLYDAHYPYRAHSELAATRFAGLASYNAEIAFMDQQVARLVSFIQERELDERTLFVIAGDHGEGLGEHGENEHGYLLNDEAVRVPLLFVLPGLVTPGHRVASLASLSDVLPTILDVVGVPASFPTYGRSLLAALDGESVPSRSIYGETDLPLTTYGWSPLRSLTTPRWRYIRTTQPELYDRATDPGELRNLVGTHPQTARVLERRLEKMEARFRHVAGQEMALDADARRRLEALGYLAGQQATSGGPLRDVKEMLPVKRLAARLSTQIATNGPGTPEAAALARELVRQSPESASFHHRLGAILLARNELDDAVRELTEAVRLQSELAEAHSDLGTALTRQGKQEEAMREFAAALRLDPTLPEAHLGVGTLLVAQGKLRDAKRSFEDAVRFKPDWADAHLNLANCLARLQEPRQAVDHYETALRLKPDSALAHYNLALLLARRDDVGEALHHAREAVRLAPDMASAHYHLGRLLAEEGHQAEAIASYSEAMRLQPEEPAFADDLAAAYAATGRFADAAVTARSAAQLARRRGQKSLAADIERRATFYERQAKRR